MGEHWRLVNLMLAEGFLSVIFFPSSALSQLFVHQFFLALLQVSSLGLSNIWRWVKNQNPTIIYMVPELLCFSSQLRWIGSSLPMCSRPSLPVPGDCRLTFHQKNWEPYGHMLNWKPDKVTKMGRSPIPPTIMLEYHTETRCNLRFPDEIGRVTSGGWFPQNTICPDITQMFMPGMMPGEYSHGLFIMIAISRSGGLMIAIVVSFVFVTPPWFPTTDRARLPLLLHQVLLQQRVQTSPCAAHARSCDSRRCAEDAPDETGTSRDQRLAKRI